MIKVEIVIPCYNEERNLEYLWTECKAVVEESNNEISFIIVNNGSTDNTSHFINSHSGLEMNIRFISVQPNRGYGGGIVAGLQETSTEYIGWTHADLQTPLRDCILAKSFADTGFDFVKGNRTGRPLIDHFFSLGMGILMSLLFQIRLREVNAQPTLMRRTFFMSWVNPPNDFSIDLYSLVMAKKRRLKIARFKVEFLKRLQGESSWNFSLMSRSKFISRTLKYSLKLRRSLL
jgi:glycosyltransferase involved in cell wall biosynthesis